MHTHTHTHTYLSTACKHARVHSALFFVTPQLGARKAQSRLKRAAVAAAKKKK